MSDRILAARAPAGVERAAVPAGSSLRPTPRDRERGNETYRAYAESLTADAKTDARADAVQAAAKVDDAAVKGSDGAKKGLLRPTLESASKRIEEFLNQIGRRLKLDHTVDKESAMRVVSVRDAESGELIRQIPSEEMLRIARSVGYYQSALVNLQA